MVAETFTLGCEMPKQVESYAVKLLLFLDLAGDQSDSSSIKILPHNPFPCEPLQRRRSPHVGHMNQLFYSCSREEREGRTSHLFLLPVCGCLMFGTYYLSDQI